MDIGAVEKGKGKGGGKDKGKSKGNGKDKGKGKKGGKDKGKGKSRKDTADGKPQAEVTCFYCNKKGHRKVDCRAWAADRQQEKPGDVNAMTEDGQDDWIFGVELCEALEAGLHALEHDGGGDEAPPCDTSSSEDEYDEWLMMDSGVAVSTCPLDYAPEVAQGARGTTCPLRSVTGESITHTGSKAVEFVHDNGAQMNVSFEVADVRRPIVAVNSFADRGMTVVFTPEGGFVTRGSVEAPPGPVLGVRRGAGHFWMHGRRSGSAPRKKTSTVPIVTSEATIAPILVSRRA